MVSWVFNFGFLQFVLPQSHCSRAALVRRDAKRRRLTQRGRRGTLYRVDAIPMDGHAPGALVHAKLTRTRSVWRRRIAAAAGAILLLAQSLGAAHYHPVASAQHPSIAAAATPDSLCSLCLHHQHAPGIGAAQFPLDAPSDIGRRDSNDFCFALVSSFDSHLFGRAPPASV